MRNWLIPLSVLALLRMANATIIDNDREGFKCDPNHWYTVDIEAPFRIDGNIGSERFELNWSKDDIPNGKKLLGFKVIAQLEWEEETEVAPSPTSASDSYDVDAGDFIRAVGQHIMLKSVHGTYLRAWKGDPTPRLVDMAPHAKEWEHWSLESYAGWLMLRSIHDSRTYLRARKNGAVDHAGGTKAMEMMWMPYKSEYDGSWSFRSPDGGLWLSAGSDGSVHAVARRAASTRFWLEAWQEQQKISQGQKLVYGDSYRSNNADKRAFWREFGGKRMFKSTSSGKYLRAWRAGHEKPANTVDMAPHAKDWEHWTVALLEGDLNKIVLQSFHTHPRTYLRGNRDGSVTVENALDEQSTWTRFKNDDGSWSLKSYYGQWLSSRPSTSVHTMINKGSREHFWLESWN